MSATEQVRIDEVRSIDPGDWPSLLDLYGRYFGERSARFFKRRWRWQFEANPWVSARPSLIQLGRAGGRIVAHFSAFPVPIRLAGRSMIALCASDLVVDERFRHLVLPLMSACAHHAPVIGVGLSPEAARIFEAFGGSRVPLSTRRFCRRSRFAALRPGWWRRLAGRSRFAAAAPVGDAGSASAGRNGHVHRLPRFEREYDDLWAHAGIVIKCSLDKTSTYMNWRYVDSPAAASCRLAIRDDDRVLRGVLVAALHARRGRRRAHSWGEILELVCDREREEYASPLIRSAVRRLHHDGVSSIEAGGLRVEYHDLLARLGFARRDSGRFALHVLPADSRASPTFDGSDDLWYVTAGDGDALYDSAMQCSEAG